MRWLFRRLDATPSQERTLREVAEVLAKAASGARSDAAKLGSAIAASVRADVVDDEALRGLREELSSLHDKTEASLAAAIAQVHAALDPTQRERLAALLERAGYGPMVGGPYRSATI